jgi:predicted nucleic acid-binding protein
MAFAYVDSSCLVAIAFDEPGAKKLAARLRRFDRLFSSNLLEAELRSALSREGVDDRAEDLLSWIAWIYPNRPLTAEYTRIAAAGYLKGADLWHLANALFLSPDAGDLSFLSLDTRQADVAGRLGFSLS